MKANNNLKLTQCALPWWQLAQNNPGMNIGRVIKALRVEQGLKLEPLANDLDLATSTLSRIESGRHKPALDNLVRIADALGVRVSDIFRAAEDADLPPDSRALEPATDYSNQSLQLRKHFHALNDGNRQVALDLMKTLAKSQKVEKAE